MDIVNEQDEVVGQGEVEEIHQKDLLHRSVHIFIKNHQGRFYSRQRSLKSPRYPGYWTTSIGTHVASGSTYKQTAYQSLKNKMGVSCALDYIGKVRVHDEYENEISTLYVGKISRGVKIKPNPDEPGRFFTTDELRKLPSENKVTPYVLQSLDLYLENKN